jgi:hypothetical protein
MKPILIPLKMKRMQNIVNFIKAFSCPFYMFVEAGNKMFFEFFFRILICFCDLLAVRYSSGVSSRFNKVSASVFSAGSILKR